MAGQPDFVPYFNGIRARTERLVPLIPPDRLEWNPSPGAMSFGDILRHIAGTEQWMWAENVAGRPARYPGQDERLARGYDATCEYFARLHREALDSSKRSRPGITHVRSRRPPSSSCPRGSGCGR